MAADDAIIPDTKDWTWVLQRACPECWFDPGTIDVDRVPELVTANAAAWRDVLARPDVAQRPRADVWSPLEYACHVRDVFILFNRRLHLMLTEDDPQFTNWDQDETAIVERYAQQDPARVSDELTAAATQIAASFAAVEGSEWSRPGRRSDGAEFTVESFARYFIHDPVHHLHDVR